MTYWDGSQWTQETSPPAARRRDGKARRVGAAIAEAALITSLSFCLIATTAFARGSKGVITVPDGVFASTTTATLNPGGDVMALAKCYQDGTLVYAQYVQADSTNHALFKLGPTPMWTSGSANCTAEEGAFGNGGRWHALATTTFNVSG